MTPLVDRVTWPVRAAWVTVRILLLPEPEQTRSPRPRLRCRLKGCDADWTLTRCQRCGRPLCMVRDR